MLSSSGVPLLDQLREQGNTSVSAALSREITRSVQLGLIRTKRCSSPHHVGGRVVSTARFGRVPSRADGLNSKCHACAKAQRLERTAAHSWAGVTRQGWDSLSKEERADIMARYRAHIGLAGPNPTPAVTDGLTSSRPSVPRRPRNDSLPRLARPPKRRARRLVSINRRADHGPGFLYAMYDPSIYNARREIKLGLTTNLDRRLGQAHNLGDFRYLAFVPVSDMKNAETWLMKTYANECIENERFRIPSFEEIRSMLSLAASTFKADRGLFVGLDSNHPEVTTSDR